MILIALSNECVVVVEEGVATKGPRLPSKKQILVRQKNFELEQTKVRQVKDKNPLQCPKILKLVFSDGLEA